MIEEDTLTERIASSRAAVIAEAKRNAGDCEHGEQLRALPSDEATYLAVATKTGAGPRLLDHNGRMICSCAAPSVAEPHDDHPPEIFEREIARMQKARDVASDQNKALEEEFEFERLRQLEAEEGDPYESPVADESGFEEAHMYDHDCKLCPLHGRATTVCVAGEGPLDAEVMVLGGNPDSSEDTSFAGSGGALLDRFLGEAGLSRERMFVSNAVKCATPKGRTPSKKEMLTCSTYLLAEIAAVRPRIIVTLGNTPLQALTGEAKISAMHGKPQNFSAAVRKALDELGVPDTYQPMILPIFDPRMTSHKAGIDVQIVADLKLVADDAQNTFVDIDTPWEWATTDTLHGVLSGDVVSFDIETNGKPIHHPDFRIAMVAIDCGGRTVGVYRGLAVADGIKALAGARERGAVLVGHNGSGYDRAAIKQRTGVDLKCDDSQLVAHLLFEDDRKALEALAVRHLGVRPWKDMVTWEWSQLTTGMTPEQWETCAAYCARDTRYTRLLWLKLKPLLDADPALRNYYDAFFLPLSRALSAMELRGQYVSLDHIAAELGRTWVKKIGAEACARDLSANPTFNPGSAKQVRALLFDRLGLPPQEITDGGEDSTNEASIKKIAHIARTVDRFAHIPHVGQVVEAILDYRGASKLIGTYLEPYTELLAATHAPGRIFPSFSLISSVSRTASFAPNAQNWPRGVSKGYAPPGRVLVRCDASQLELRIAAHLWDSNMREALKRGDDLHALMAIAIRRARGDANPEAFTKAERTDAKPANFAFLFGADEYTFESIMLKDYGKVIERRESTLIRNAFHTAWPQLRDGYGAIIREADETGMVRSLCGRVRHLPGIHGDEKTRIESIRQAINFPVQNFGLAVAGIMLILATAWGDEVTNFIHDAIYAEIDECDQTTSHLHCGIDGEWTPFDHGCAIEKTVARYRAFKHFVPQVLQKHFGVKMTVPLEFDVDVKVGG